MSYLLGFNLKDDLLTIRRISLFSVIARRKYEYFQGTLYTTYVSVRKYKIYRDLYFNIDIHDFEKIFPLLNNKKEINKTYQKFLEDLQMYENLI